MGTKGDRLEAQAHGIGGVNTAPIQHSQGPVFDAQYQKLLYYEQFGLFPVQSSNESSGYK